MIDSIIKPHSHEHDDLRIIEVATGRHIVDDNELQWFVDHPEEAKRKLILLCTKCLEHTRERYPSAV